MRAPAGGCAETYGKTTHVRGGADQAWPQHAVRRWRLAPGGLLQVKAGIIRGRGPFSGSKRLDHNKDAEMTVREDRTGAPAAAGTKLPEGR